MFVWKHLLNVHEVFIQISLINANINPARKEPDFANHND